MSTQLEQSQSRLEKNKALVQAHYEATINCFDPEAIDEQVAPDFVDHQNTSVVGPEGVKQHIARMHQTFTDLHATIEDIVAEGDRVAVRATWKGIHAGTYMDIPATGKTITFTGMVFWRIENNQLKERWATLDTGSLLRQLGAL